jgi:hypothetical protein
MSVLDVFVARSLVPVEIGHNVEDLSSPVCLEYDTNLVVVKVVDDVDSLVKMVGVSLTLGELEDCNAIVLLELLLDLEVVVIDFDSSDCLCIVLVGHSELIERVETL